MTYTNVVPHKFEYKMRSSTFCSKFVKGGGDVGISRVQFSSDDPWVSTVDVNH